MEKPDLKLNSFHFCDEKEFTSITSSNPRTKGIAELPLAEAALSIDHILENILSQLDTSSLKSCHLVSSRWKEFGALELQKWVWLKLNFAFETDEDAQNNGDQHLTIRNCPPSLHTINSFDNLIFLMESSTIFPSASLDLSTQTLSSLQIRYLLSKVGPFLKRLKLDLDLRFERSDFHESSFLEDLKTLLTVQAPYLEIFELRMTLPFEWESEDETKFDFNSNNVMGFNPVSSTNMHLPNLKSLTLHHELPRQFFHELLDGAVNLQEYYGSYFGTYFTEHNNRINLLKQLDFELNDQSESGIVSQLLRQNQNELKLESIRITISRSLYFHDDPLLNQRALKVLRDLLEISAKTCKTLTLQPITSLPGIRIPPMPKVQSLVLLKGAAEFEPSSFEKHFFPAGFNISSVFPVLESITMVRYIFDDFSDLDLEETGTVIPGVNFRYFKDEDEDDESLVDDCDFNFV